MKNKMWLECKGLPYYPSYGSSLELLDDTLNETYGKPNQNEEK